MFSSSGGSKKAPQQVSAMSNRSGPGPSHMWKTRENLKEMQSQKQEMVQVDRAESTSPFWRLSQRDPVPPGTTKEPKVVGASYSHADVLKFDTLNISSSSRPRTPPSSHSAKLSPAARSTSSLASPPFKNYMNFLSSTNEDWAADEGDGAYGYDEDGEDEFGLPSLRKKSKKPPSQSHQSHLTIENTALVSPTQVAHELSPIEPGLGLHSRRFSNSADIGFERPTTTYPMPKKSEGKILRPQYKDILRDPANSLHLINHQTPLSNATQKEIDDVNSRMSRINRFKKLLQSSNISLSDLRSLAWSGVPWEVRSMTWQVLLGYLPTGSERRVATLDRKRKDYLEGVRVAFERKSINVSSPGKARGVDESIWHQISIDVPRTNPHIELYGYEATQRSLERILYVWAVRHPASGYVQGINDLVTPFWQTFLQVYIQDPEIETGMDPGQLPKSVLDAVEADSFWCLTKLLDGIQDHYIAQQPGIHRQVNALRDLTARIDAGLARHFESQGVEFIQFSFRWMNCLLMREISVRNTIRMWDTYLAEEQGFSEFHLYVCAAFLVKWSDKLMKMDFQDIMIFLQTLPTKTWTEKDVELLLSEAYIWQSLFKGSSAHLRGPGSRQPSAALPNVQL